MFYTWTAKVEEHIKLMDKLESSGFTGKIYCENRDKMTPPLFPKDLWITFWNPHVYAAKNIFYPVYYKKWVTFVSKYENECKKTQ